MTGSEIEERVVDVGRRHGIEVEEAEVVDDELVVRTGGFDHEYEVGFLVYVLFYLQQDEAFEAVTVHDPGSGERRRFTLQEAYEAVAEEVMR